MLGAYKACPDLLLNAACTNTRDTICTLRTCTDRAKAVNAATMSDTP